MDGGLSRVHQDWAARLVRLLASQEALIDFPDEDLPPEAEDGLVAEIAFLRDEIARHLDDGRRGERLREGLVFAITGPPNAGKSTLINALARREVAIVSPTPGTTRDVLEVRLDIGGVPVTLLDTAGLREAEDPVEAEGVRRARARAAAADFVIELVDATLPAAGAGAGAGAGVDDGAGTGIGISIGTGTPAGGYAEMPARLRIATKLDLAPCPAGIEIAVAAPVGAGLDVLHDRLAAAARDLTERAGPPPLTRARHRAALADAVSRLEAAAGAPLPELRGEDLRLALRAVGRVTGHVGVEDILDSVFRQFCIGK
jgi:tRNA modification GTPase